jgi:type I restriction enzyme S subunit
MSRNKKAKAANDDGKPALVPKLRFPEFRGDGEWGDFPLGTLLTSSPDYGVNAAAVPFSEHLPKYLRITDISEDGRYLSEKQVSVDFDASDGNYLDEGDIVLARTGASVGKSYQYRKEDGRLVFAGFLIRVKPQPKKLVSTYLANFLTTGQFWKWVAVTSARSGQPGINSTECCSLTIPLPPTLPEQQKIAECLSSVDEVIAAQARNVDALKTHKKGLMQQLFPREGETQPRLRFPEFQKDGEWVAKPLGELVELQSGFAFSSSNFGREGRKLVTPKNFTKHGHGNFDESVSKYTTEDVPDRFVCKPGDLLVLLTDLTPTCELLGKPLLLEKKDGTVLLNQRVVRVEPSASELETLFLKYVFLSEPYSQRIIKTATGSTVKHSSNKVLQEMPLYHPTHPEQHSIASCLSSLDALITAEMRKLEALKRHKRGLMQQLFPSPEEVEA